MYLRAQEFQIVNSGYFEIGTVSLTAVPPYAHGMILTGEHAEAESVCHREVAVCCYVVERIVAVGHSIGENKEILFLEHSVFVGRGVARILRQPAGICTIMESLLVVIYSSTYTVLSYMVVAFVSILVVTSSWRDHVLARLGMSSLLDEAMLHSSYSKEE